MIVCSCNVLSDGQIRACLRDGSACPRTAAQVYRCLGCSPQCGRCARTIRSIVAATIGESHACNASCAATCPLSALSAHEAVDPRGLPGADDAAYPTVMHDRAEAIEAPLMAVV